MQSKRILLEDAFGTFQADRKKIVFESASGRQLARIPGRLSLCDTVNGNNRRYRKSVWEKNLKEGSPLQEAIKKNAAFGLLEHPSDGHVDLRSPIAILVTKAELVEENGKPVVNGEILVLGTPEGQRLIALIEAGWDPTVSSRGYGSLVKGPDGVDEVQDDYVCEGWDVVLKPSFIEAIMSPLRAPVGEQKQEARGSSEIRPETSISPGSGASSQSSSPVAALKESAQHDCVKLKPLTNNCMMDEIKARLASLKGVDTSKLTLIQYAEGINEMKKLHQEAAAYLAENQKASWEVSKVHEEISALERSWTEAAELPMKKCEKLSEDVNKLMRVTNAVVESAVESKKQLGEKLVQVENLRALLEQTVEKGKKWKSSALELKESLDELNKRFDFACLGLERIAERYKNDVTALGRRVLELEFQNELAESAKVRGLLERAKLPRHLVEVRRKLEVIRKIKEWNESKGDKNGASVQPDHNRQDSQPDKPAMTESKDQNPQSPVRTSLEKVTVLSSGEFGPVKISESVAVAQRLSRAATMAQ